MALLGEQTAVRTKTLAFAFAFAFAICGVFAAVAEDRGAPRMQQSVYGAIVILAVMAAIDRSMPREIK